MAGRRTWRWADAKEFRNQYPAYAADRAGETRKALDALHADPIFRSRYGDFIIAMSYGERPDFDVALAAVVALSENAMQHEGTAHDDRQDASRPAAR